MLLGFKPQFREKILNGTKLHTIREDAGKRWKPGMIIHAAVGVRTKHFECFSIMGCTAVQDIEFIADAFGDLTVFIDSSCLSRAEVEVLARNDGFDTLEEFEEWFKREMKRTGTSVLKYRLIHWTIKR